MSIFTPTAPVTDPTIPEMYTAPEYEKAVAIADEFNEELVRKVFAWVTEEHQKKEQDPSYRMEWDQTEWGRQITNGVCRTSQCFAGKTAILAGKELHYSQEVEDEDILEKLGFGPNEEMSIASYTQDGYFIPAFAINVLGITDWEADELFAGGLTYEEMGDVLSQMFDARGLEL